MEYAIINKKTVRSNKQLKMAGKEARKYYGRTRGGIGKKARAKIGKVVSITDLNYMDLTAAKAETSKDGVAAQAMTNSACSSESSETKVGNRTMFHDLSMEERRSKLIELCRENHLTGRSGSGFETTDKLDAFSKRKAKESILLVNGVECDPGLAHDAWLYRNEYIKVQAGIELLKQCFTFDRVIVATREPENRCHEEAEYCKIPYRYPMGYENQLISYVLGLEMKKGEHPTDVGILELNLQTVIAIGELAENSCQIETKYITVADLTKGTATVVKVNQNASATNVLEKVLGKCNTAKRYIGGGALSSRELQDQDTIDEKVNFLAYANAPEYQKATSCRGCGGCTKKCPMGIKVDKIVKQVENKNESNLVENIKEFHPENCIGCSACTYGCPAGKNLQGMIAKLNGKA